MQPLDSQQHHLLLQCLDPLTVPGTPGLEHQERNGDTQGADATKKVSPIAWQNTNLHGRYEFQKQPDLLNVEAIVAGLLQRSANRAGVRPA